MQHISEIIEDILVEWAYRVHDGMPNPKNALHIVQLRESMEELNLPSKVIYEVIENLINEVDNTVPDKVKKKAKQLGLIWKRVGYGKEGEEGITHKVEDGKLVPVEDGKSVAKSGEEETDSVGKSMDIKMNPQDKDGEKQKKKSSLSSTYAEKLKSSDRIFRQKNRDNKTKSTYTLPDSVRNNPKIPKKYTQLLERMLNTKSNIADNTHKAEYYGLEDVGGGNLDSGIGELMTMMSTTMRSNEANDFFNSINEHLGKLKAGGEKTHVSEKWVKAAKQNRSAILNLFRDRFGNDYEIEAGAWDVEQEVRDMGMDYGEKGYSTDVFFKVKSPEGDTIFAEISLKQGLTANLHNGTVGSTFKDFDLPMHLKPSTYSDNQVANNDNYLQNNQHNIREFINTLDTTDPNFEELLAEVAKEMSPNRIANQEAIILQFKEMIKNAQEDLLSDGDLVVDRNYVGSIRQAGEKTKGGFTEGRKETLKPFVVLARLQSKYGDDTATTFIDQQKKLSKDYARSLITEIGQSKEAKDVVLKSVQEKLPLKSVADGDEDIILADTALTDKTLKAVFGTSDWNEIKENLEVDADSDPPVITYVGEIKGKEKIIPISTIVVREDGIAYRGAHKFEMKLDSSFGKRVKDASAEIYNPQEPLPYPVGRTKPSPTGGRDVEI